MNIAVVHSCAQIGIEAPPVTVEVHLANGLPSLAIVGLPETAVKESKDRVRSAIINSRFEFPARRITINLAPADLPKDGGRFDLPIAIGILVASGQLPHTGIESCEFAGELALTGKLRSIRGVLNHALQSKKQNRALILPIGNASEAALVKDLEILPAITLLEVAAHIAGQKSLVAFHAVEPAQENNNGLDLDEIVGQFYAKRALEIAAAGGHSLLMMGPPGSGKTMLASRLPGILPPLNEAEALSTAAVYSISHHGLALQNWKQRPFRAPHHTASAIALVGGGSLPMPGEISLAHNGVLFLDELPEFDRRVLEALREPIEKGSIIISRAARQAEYPARFQFIAAMNPCPCGYLGSSSGRCHCTPNQVTRYRGKISGPLLDRIDMHIEVPQISYKEILRKSPSTKTEDSATVRQRVIKARQRQMDRGHHINADLNNKQVDEFCRLTTAAYRMLEQSISRLDLSARGYHRVLKISRTIADLAASTRIQQSHIAEALHYRVVDRRRHECTAPG